MWITRSCVQSSKSSFRASLSACLLHPVRDVVWKPLVELVEILRDDKPVVPDVAAIDQREWVSFVLLLFYRQIQGKIG